MRAIDDGPSPAVKTVVLDPRNPGHGLPQINDLATLLDSGSGLPLAILDGNRIAAVRTAGFGANTARYMARKDSSVIAFIGCGVQASSHLETFSKLFPLAQVCLFGRIADLADIASAVSSSRDAREHVLPTTT